MRVAILTLLFATSCAQDPRFRNPDHPQQVDLRTECIRVVGDRTYYVSEDGSYYGRQIPKRQMEVYCPVGVEPGYFEESNGNWFGDDYWFHRDDTHLIYPMPYSQYSFTDGNNIWGKDYTRSRYSPEVNTNIKGVYKTDSDGWYEFEYYNGDNEYAFADESGVYFSDYWQNDEDRAFNSPQPYSSAGDVSSAEPFSFSGEAERYADLPYGGIANAHGYAPGQSHQGTWEYYSGEYSYVPGSRGLRFGQPQRIREYGNRYSFKDFPGAEFRFSSGDGGFYGNNGRVYSNRDQFFEHAGTYGDNGWTYSHYR